LDLEITTIDYASGSTTLTLTWASNLGDNYNVNFSEDMIDWTRNLNVEEIPAAEGTSTTGVFDTSGLDITGTKLFFRIEKL